ncbi:DegV domain-containing protein [Tepiditoga spiralis]|uniref:DegV domain-containing protein n=1 Tax=Tepiditoga spiralis TaxID=2108365 RepID=A0A7G1GA56_9BACT|nr:DegV family protein [Tepiditoga spiralis]BBE31953.1 DegV domain-containing protein [Tepiditoga spiralis]
MPKRAILIDSGCAVTDEILKKYNAELIGMNVVLDEKTFIDGITITKDEYYSKIFDVNEFHTSQPSIGSIVKIYQDLKDKGFDEIVDIHFSSKMSGLINTCEMARNMVEDIKIHIIDTESISIGAYLIAEKIMELLQTKSFEEVEKLLPEIKKSSYMQFSVPTLKYLIKNGRIGKAQGLAGTILNIKPILGVEDGFIAPIAKIRGMNKVYLTMKNNAIKFIKDRPNNVKIYIIHSLEKNKEQMLKAYNLFMEDFSKLGIKDYRVIEGRISPTVASHSGPEVFGLAVYGEKEPIK